MPVPMWVARANKHVFNPRELRRGVRPVLTHVGRASGRIYRTPLDAHAVVNGYVFIAMYGPASDWVQNVLSAGSARLDIDGESVDLGDPRLITGPAAQQLMKPTWKPPAGFWRVKDYLHMGIRQGTSGGLSTANYDSAVVDGEVIA